MRVLLANPLLRLEFLRRFRTAGAAWSIVALSILPILGVTFIYGVSGATMGNVTMDGGSLSFNRPLQSAQQLELGGPQLLVGTCSILSLILVLLVPAIVGASIASERQNATLQPLQLTKMRPIDIIVGKLVSSLGFIILMLVCLAPILIVPYLAGGVPVSTIVKAYLVIIAISVELAALSIFVSSRAKRPVGAVVGSLIVSLILIAGPWVIAALIAIADSATGGGGGRPADVVWLSPMSLFGTLPNVGTVRFMDWWDSGDRTAVVLCWFVVCAMALAASLRGVSAPVEKDR